MAVTITPLQNYGTMLQTLRARCGLHATIGQAPALNDILTEAHEYVYQQLDDGYPVISTMSLVANTEIYPFMGDDAVPIARGSVQEIWIVQGNTDRQPLSQGINHSDRADPSLRDIPCKWDSRFVNEVWSMEVWPTPDQAYLLYVDNHRILTKFNDAADMPSVNYRLVLGYAIAMGKAHYSKPDAEVAGQAFKTMLSKEKYLQKENRRFIPPDSFDSRRPRVVSTATGFRQVGY
jgi:hypothetical protein